jgi:hypothetical protein
MILNDCQACGREAPLLDLPSQVMPGVDVKLCVVCADHGAEPYQLICESVRAGIWRNLHRIDRRRVRIYFGENYLKTQTYARMRKHTQLAIIRQEIKADEQDRAADFVLTMTQIIPDEPPRAQRGWIGSLIDWFRGHPPIGWTS